MFRSILVRVLVGHDELGTLEFPALQLAAHEGGSDAVVVVVFPQENFGVFVLGREAFAQRLD